MAGCGGGDGSKPAPRHVANDPPLCARLHARVTGHVRTGAATELSGLVASRRHRGVLWTHNDSGDGPRLLTVGTDGRSLGELPVTGAENVDWEDIAAAGGDLYIGDIGDNLAQRPTITVYRVSERNLTGAVPAQGFTLRYPDGAHDAEALLVSPSRRELAVVTKSLSGSATVYVSPPAGGTMRRAAKVKLGNALQVTAGDVSADGRTVVLRTYDRAFVWKRHRGESLAALFGRSPCVAGADLLVEGQGESIALTRDGRAFYTVPEGRHAALRRWAPGR